MGGISTEKTIKRAFEIQKAEKEALFDLEKKYFEKKKEPFIFNIELKQQEKLNLISAELEKIAQLEIKMKEQNKIQNDAFTELQSLGIKCTKENASKIKEEHIEKELKEIQAVLMSFIISMKSVVLLDAEKMKFNENKILIDKIKTVTDTCHNQINQLSLSFLLPTED